MSMRRRVVIGVIVAVSLVALVAAAIGAHTYLKVRSQLDSVDRISLDVGGDRPVSATSARGGGQDDLQGLAAGKPVTFLLAGTDGRGVSIAEAMAGGDWQVGAMRSDTLLLAQLSGDRKSVTAVSIPRDTLVEIDGYGPAKVNAALSYGGPNLLVQTLEEFSGVRVDHVVFIDWEGFRSLTDALGGVEVYVAETTTDVYQNRTFTKGATRLSGSDALAYVRQRHGLPNGDFDRIKRQQNFMRALMRKVLSGGGLATPSAATRTVGSVVEYLTVDDSLDTDALLRLAWTVRNLEVSDVAFLTIPLGSFDTVNGQSVIVADSEVTSELFAAMRTGALDAFAASHPELRLEQPRKVR